jgi:hypothetical protein
VEEVAGIKIEKERLINDLLSLGYKIYYADMNRVFARKRGLHLMVVLRENSTYFNLHEDVGHPHKAIYYSKRVKREMEEILRR